MTFRVGIGWDAHPAGGAGPLRIGGIEISRKGGLKGHSDADVLVHAVCDALLGAAGLPDLGTHFPDTDPAYKNINSIQLLKEVVSFVREKNFDIVNIDSVIIAQAPRFAPHFPEMKREMSEAMGVGPELVGVKASSPEGLGAIGKGEGIAAQCVACLEIKDETKR